MASQQINAAISAQLSDLEHAMLAGFTHRPVVELSERLAAIAPGGWGIASSAPTVPPRLRSRSR